MKQSINQFTQLEITIEFESDMIQSEIDNIVSQFEYGYSNYDDFINDEEVQANYWGWNYFPSTTQVVVLGSYNIVNNKG